jgi:hypothetical protein
MRRTISATLFLMAAAPHCAPPATPATGHTATAPLASGAPAAATEYFHGTSEVYPLPRAEGAPPVATTRALIRRTVDPARSVIVEDVVSEDGRGRPAREYVVTMTVSGAAFTMEERAGAFRGTGTLEGPPWRWSAWTSHAVLPDGGMVDSRDRLTDASLEVEKEYRGAHGAVLMVEHFARIDHAAYDRLRAELGVAPAAP